MKKKDFFTNLTPNIQVHFLHLHRSIWTFLVNTVFFITADSQ